MPEAFHLVRPLAELMPRLPGLTALAGSLRTYVPSPVWRGSEAQEVRWQPLPKKGSQHESSASVRFGRTDHEDLSVFSSANQPVRLRVAVAGLADILAPSARPWILEPFSLPDTWGTFVS